MTPSLVYFSARDDTCIAPFTIPTPGKIVAFIYLYIYIGKEETSAKLTNNTIFREEYQGYLVPRVVY